MRPSRRQPDELRAVSLERGVVKYAEGSCFVKFGDTHVLVTATLEDRLPPWLKGQQRGWVTAEYGMLPRATSTRTQREASAGRVGRSRTATATKKAASATKSTANRAASSTKRAADQAPFAELLHVIAVDRRMADTQAHLLHLFIAAGADIHIELVDFGDLFVGVVFPQMNRGVADDPAHDAVEVRRLRGDDRLPAEREQLARQTRRPLARLPDLVQAVRAARGDAAAEIRHDEEEERRLRALGYLQ